MRTSTRRAHTAAVALVALAWVLCTPLAAHAAAQPRLIVGFRSSTPDHAQLRAVGAASARSVEAVPELDAQVVEVPAARLDAVRRQLLARPDVAYVEVDHVARAYDLAGSARSGIAAQWWSNDTLRSQQWHLDTMRVDDAWRHSRGTGVLIAVIDTGVDYIHPDLAGRVELGRDFVDGDADPMDVQGHGTHVAGIAAAAANDRYGVAGVAPASRILAVRVLDAEGGGNYSQVAEGIVHAVKRGARVLNLSLGGPQQSTLLRSAVDYAAARGAIVTCATGNDAARTIGYPARSSSCLAVGATDLMDGITDFSNRGAGIDVVAPGSQVMSTVMGARHEAWDGTSMATPTVSGVAALLLAQGISRRDAVAAIQSTARDRGAAGYDTTFGHGIVDAAAAVEAAARMPRRQADTVKPVIDGIEVGAAERTVHTTWKQAWKLRSRSGFRRVGTSEYLGRYAYSRVVITGSTRKVETYRFARGVVYRRTVVYVQRRVPVRRVSTLRPVRVTASDDLGVDRVAVQVDGVVQGVDWLESGGWQVMVACGDGVHDVSAWAYDVADNEVGGAIRTSLAC